MTHLFSEGLREQQPAVFGPAIEQAFCELRQCCTGAVRCFAWNEHYVAAAFSVQVDRPSHGTARGVDIRDVEPMLLLFDRSRYPYVAPQARSDRKDFPADSLPHLNPVAPHQPAWLCLWRGDVNDWFAEHTLSELVRRIRGWLRDAACGMLIPDGDFFEATRLNDACGAVVFDDHRLARHAAKLAQATDGASGFGFCSLVAQSRQEREKAEDSFFPFAVKQWHLPSEKLAQRLQQFAQHNEQAAQVGQAQRQGFGLVLATASTQPIREYFGYLPTDVAGLSALCQRLGVSFEAGISAYLASGFFTLGFLPIILAIHRPQPLEMGTSVEPLCFLILPSAIEDERKVPPPTTPVVSLYHHFPLAPDRAAKIAGVKATAQRTLLFGCGALGSKLALHRARAGDTALTAVDRAVLSEHNIVRHGLMGEYRGLPKAEALRRAIVSLFGDLPAAQQPMAYGGSALAWLHGDCRQYLKEHHLLIDATASVMMLDALSHASLPPRLQVVRCAIADSGQLGLLMIEGKNRNPRVDDLQVWLYNQALEYQPISQWLQQERRQKEQRFSTGLAEVPLGLGCSSITMRLPDDLVSVHAAQFSLALRELGESSTPAQSGWLTWQFSSSSGLAVERLVVEPVLVIPAAGASDWQVRMQAQAAHEIRRQLHSSAPNETGGVMIGTVNPKQRIIYVTRLLPMPADSTSSPGSFKRGTCDLPPAAEHIYEATGGMLGYVGDWHTHPRGSGAASPTDIATLQNTKRNFEVTGLPAFILIATPKGFRAHIKETA